MNRSGYIRTLDGWRTIAVGGVIWCHAAQTPIRALQGLQDFGREGVSLFFAISGILICSRILEEQRVNGRISLAGFYLRRLCRIQPAAVTYLLVLAALALLGVIRFNWWGWTSALFSYRNLYAAAGGGTLADRYTEHFWSLAVEEHFYILVPLIMVIFRRRLLAVLVVLSGLSLIWRPIVHRSRFLRTPALGCRTDTVVQILLVAALLAVLLTIPPARKVLSQITSRGILIVATICLLLISNGLLKSYYEFLICCFGFPLVVVTTVLHPEMWFSRLLETRLFAVLGRMSYSLYLWQQLFFHRAEYPFLPYPLHYLQVWPLNLVALMVVAAGSYYLIEKPFIRLGHRLAPPATSGRNDLDEHLQTSGEVGRRAREAV